VADRPPFPTAPTTWTPPSGLPAPNDARRAVVKLVIGLVAVVGLGIALIVVSGEEEAADGDEIGPLVTSAGGAATDGPGGPASLWVDAGVIGAVVLLDGDSVGTVPLWLDTVAPGDRRVSVVRGRARADTTVRLVPGAMTEVEFSLGGAALAERPPVQERPARPEPEPAPEAAAPAPPAAPAARAPTTGAVRIVTAPPGATVTVDGRRVGQTPVLVPDLTAGTYRVEATMPGHDPAARAIEVPAGRRTDAVLTLRAQTGAVEVLVRPWGTVAIDGVVRQRETDVIYRTQLPVGPHTVRVSHPTFGVAERGVEVTRNGVHRLVFDLEAGSVRADVVGGGRDGS
jgi:hypothetical protein